jgi:hypothetical protein
MMLPGTRWRPLNFVITSVVFVFVSHRVALATSDLTDWFCAKPNQSEQSRRLPTTTTTTTSQQHGREPSRTEYVALSSVETEAGGGGDSNGRSGDHEKDGSVQPPPPAPLPQSADDTTGVSSPPTGFMAAAATATMGDLRVRFALALAVLVALNWLYPAPARAAANNIHHVRPILRMLLFCFI